MDKYKAAFIFSPLLLIVMIFLGLTLQIDPISLFIPLFIIGFFVIWILLIHIIDYRLTKRMGYDTDINTIFEKGKGKMVIEDGTPIVKLLTLKGNKISYTQYKNEIEMRNKGRNIFISTIFTPLTTWLIFSPIARYRLGSSNFINMLDWLSVFLYIPLVLVSILVYITIKIENKKEPKEFTYITKTGTSIIVEVHIDEKLLQDNTPNNIFEFELNNEFIDDITTSSMDHEIQNSKEVISKPIWFIFKISKAFLKFSHGLKVDTRNINLRIKRIPEYKSKQEINAVIFISMVNKSLVADLHRLVKAWAVN